MLLAANLNVNEPEPVIVLRLKLAVTPVGSPDTENATVPVNPEIAPTVMVDVVLPPAATVREDGEAESEKSALEEPLDPDAPVTLSTPFEAVREPASPSARASTGFDNCRARFPLALEASVMLTTATTPLLIGVEF